LVQLIAVALHIGVLDELLTPLEVSILAGLTKWFDMAGSLFKTKEFPVVY
jgi:hypothetical protein